MSKQPLYPHMPKSQKPQDRLFRELNVAVADEDEAALMYMRLSLELEQIGLQDAAWTVSKIAVDENRHKGEIEQIIHQLRGGSK